MAADHAHQPITTAMGNNNHKLPLFNLGFRPFFLGAGIFAVVSILFWLAIYLFQYPLTLTHISSMQWHAHEMLYGYSMAVIAGFLLTAVKNWTGIATITRGLLVLLFGSWLCARLLWFSGTSWLLLASMMDCLFSVILLTAISRPIIITRQWKQIAIVSKVALLIVFNMLFYLGAMNILDQGVFWGIYGGLYLIISLILTMGRRVVPFFIEKGVDYPVTLPNARWLDISSMLLLLAFFIIELFFIYPALSSIFAFAIFLVNAIRLFRWHTPGIWTKPLLWSLYLSLWSICIGFLLFALGPYFGASRYLAVHALAFGGIGVITMSMMSRVSLGHTGRNVGSPPNTVGLALILLLAGAIIRIIPPLVLSQYYEVWVTFSALLWLLAFVVFTATCFPILTRPRIDGQPG